MPHDSIAFIAPSRSQKKVVIRSIRNLSARLWNEYGLELFRPRAFVDAIYPASEFDLEENTLTMEEILQNRITSLRKSETSVWYGAKIFRVVTPTPSHLVMNGKGYAAVTCHVYWKLDEMPDVCIKVTLAKIPSGGRDIFHMQSSSHETKIASHVQMGNWMQCDQCGLGIHH
jgi:hypothetical protein